MQEVKGRRSALYKKTFCGKLLIYPMGKIKVTLLKSICEDQKGRVAENRVAGLVRQYQASRQTAPTHLHNHPQSHPQSLPQKT